MLAFLEIMRSPNKCFTVGQCVMWLRCAECQVEPKMFLFSRFSAPSCICDVLGLTFVSLIQMTFLQLLHISEGLSCMEFSIGKF
jgi:hypothetical protein